MQGISVAVARPNDLVTTIISKSVSLVTSVMNTVSASKLQEDQQSFTEEMQQRQQELANSQAELNAVQSEIDGMMRQQQLVTYGTAAVAGSAIIGMGSFVLFRRRRKKKRRNKGKSGVTP